MSEEREKEYCDRCKEDLEGDGRTLWMSCFYAMNELNVPFKENMLFSVSDEAQLEQVKEPGIITLPDGKKITLSSGQYTTSHPLRPLGMFTLRVCKECRGEWLGAIETWFNKKEAPKQVNSGIYVRRNGATVEISEIEWLHDSLKRDFPHLLFFMEHDFLVIKPADQSKVITIRIQDRDIMLITWPSGATEIADFGNHSYLREELSKW